MIEKTEANRQGQPLVPITIVKCGELPLDTPVSAISQGSLNRSKVNANPIKYVYDFSYLKMLHPQTIRVLFARYL